MLGASVLLLGGGCSPRASEAVPLELLRFRQIDARSVCLNEDLDFFFSEPLDRTSITAGSVRITDEAGRNVLGTFRVREALLSFQPALPCSKDLSDAGLRPGARYRVVLGGFPRPDGIRSRAGALLSATLVLSFETAAQGGEHPLFLDPFAGPNPLLPVALDLGPGDPIRLESKEALDPTTVSGEDFELSRIGAARRAEREVIPLEARLVVNQRKRAVLELVPRARAPFAGSVLEPDSYYLRMVGRGLKMLGGRSVEPSWGQTLLHLRVLEPEVGWLAVNFADPREIAASVDEPTDADGTAAWTEGRSTVGVRFPAAAGDGHAGELELHSPPEEDDLHASALLVPEGETVDLGAKDGLVVLRAQGALDVRGRIVRRGSSPVRRALLDELDRLAQEPRESWPDLSSWLGHARELDEPWTVLIAGGDLRVPEGGSIDVDGPLLLVAGGWIRVQGRVEGREVWRSPEGGGNVSGRERVRIAPIVLDAPEVNPLVDPVRFSVVSRGYRPPRGITAWRPATIATHAGSGEARVRFLGYRTREGRVEEIGPYEDLMMLGDCAEVRIRIDLDIPAGTGEPWDPPSVEQLELHWNAPLPVQRGDDSP